MTELIELSNSRHAELKVVTTAAMEYAGKLHALNLRVAEVGKAVSSFPVFLTRNSATGTWGLSAVASFEQGKSLFVEENEWAATYRPTMLQTYPLYLMQKPEVENSYTIGILENSNAFSKDEGEPLFESSGKASMYLARITKLLEADIQNDVQTYQFGQKMEQMGLIKSIDVLVQYEDDSGQTLKGLHTLDEDKLQSIAGDQLQELSKQGYLAPMYAMLVSIFQLNTLIRRHNKVAGLKKVKQIKLEVTRESPPI